jgi:hypothetical protein
LRKSLSKGELPRGPKRRSHLTTFQILDIAFARAKLDTVDSLIRSGRTITALVELERARNVVAEVKAPAAEKRELEHAIQVLAVRIGLD